MTAVRNGPDSTAEVSVFHFDNQFGNLPLALRSITDRLAELDRKPKSEPVAGAGAEIAADEADQRRLPVRRSPAVVREWGWCDPGTGIATNLG